MQTEAEIGVMVTSGTFSWCLWEVRNTVVLLSERFQPQWPSPRAQLGSPPPPPPGADTRPAPPGRSQSSGSAHLWCFRLHSSRQCLLCCGFALLPPEF